MYYFNIRLKPSTAYVILRRKKHIWNRHRPNKLSLYRRYVCFLHFYVRALSRMSTSARKKLCSATLRKMPAKLTSKKVQLECVKGQRSIYMEKKYKRDNAGWYTRLKNIYFIIAGLKGLWRMEKGFEMTNHDFFFISC